MNTKRLLSMLVSLIISGSLLLSACAPAQSQGNNQAEKLLGSWNAAITTPAQGTFPALMTFTADGIVIADESPTEFESAGHGNWKQNDSGEIAYTFVSLYGSEEAANTGKLKVIGTLNPDSGKDSWSGPFQIDVYDASGQVVFSDNGTVNLIRIEVEALPQAE